ncbi:MAG: cyclic beta 1-2 glucan synthetase, partial [Deltaproteobacteria bacterium]|nr:cyclic beta 1-2 glucan synthetase [Nannocystaceae bacterium]
HLLHEHAAALTELDHVAPWAALPDADGLDALVSLDHIAELALDELPSGALREVAGVAKQRARARLDELRQLAKRARELGHAEYGFLYDRERRLLSIGFSVSEHRLDASFYDLLASEARLASYLAIAEGQLPQEHWFSLGRMLTSSAGRPSLLSWSGSMFEYLMPLLVMPTYDGTVLDETYKGMIARQIAYGQEQVVPWGISESGYAKVNAQRDYQYQAFGVPGLGFKRGLGDDLVIAPYAAVMALMVEPEAAYENLVRLERDGRMGAFGFYEAIDYTRARLPPRTTSATVRSYMAHHQGMALLAIDYLLQGRPMQRRFLGDPALRATELLLQERVPRSSAIFPHPADASALRQGQGDDDAQLRFFDSPTTATPELHLLSNGHYHVVVTNSGGGYSRWGELAVTRWREDPTRDGWGMFGYLRDPGTGAFWSIAHQPTLHRAERYEAIYSHGRAEFRRRDGDIETHVEISVSSEDDVELRRVSVTNHGRTVRNIELTSYAEIVLNSAAADSAHAAFSNLFVQTELVPERGAILCTRRPRSAHERSPWMFHLMTVSGGAAGAPSFESSRAAFIGRNRSLADPLAMHNAALGNSAGAVLDPIVAIRNQVVIEPHATARLQIFNGIAQTREAALALVERYTDQHLADRLLELSFTHSQVEQRRVGVAEHEAQLYDRLAGSILYLDPRLRAPRGVIARNVRGQAALWAYGISGDLPIVLVRISDLAHIELVRQSVLAHAYWRSKGVIVDLVIWNEDPTGYRQELQERIMAAIGPLGEVNQLDRPGGIFVRRSEQISELDSVLMQTIARVILRDDAGSFAEQVGRGGGRLEMPPRLMPGVDRRRPAPGASTLGPLPPRPTFERPDLTAWNGMGGFTGDGREYVITTQRGAPTPAPWSNVMANPWFGTVVTDSGGGYTWCENAHSYRLTPWHNDPVTDGSGEALYLRDEQDGRVWSPTALPAGDEAPYVTRHGFGYSVYEHTTGDGISSELTCFVATDAPIKFYLLELHNRSGRARRISLTLYVELVLGAQRAANMPHVVTELDPHTGAVLARNSFDAEFAQRVAFLDASEAQRTVTGDRTEFIGRGSSTGNPASMQRARLSGRVGAGYDPCMAVQVTIDLAEGQKRELAFTFGSGRDQGDALHLVSRFRGVGPAREALAQVWGHWGRTLGSVQVRTPDPKLDFLANGWLLYQVLAARMWARSGFYQSGGAYGFRDQLQDSMALVHADPALLREQLLRSASRQFAEGDVQHWWHPPMGRGVRTRISDDYLWLPYATCRYVATIGDTGVLDEQVHFLEGRAVKSNEDSYYDLPVQSEQATSLYQHCVRACEHAMRYGVHGLPLMGTGDWNDGMNLVGDDGRGESVWLAFFLHDVLTRFAELARSRNDNAFAQRCTEEAGKLAAAIEAHGWDGAWYRRAYFDDGSPLGSASSEECQIDSLPQSWAALTGVGDPARTQQALASLDQRLVRRDIGVVQLLDPPFDTAPADPGYIKGYVPGVRENGGQYTHAAVWTAMAFASVGDSAKAWEIFDLINPVRHGDSAEAIAVYKVEPYVVAADVYTNPQHAGRGGWTWYTGSAGWMYRLIIESLLGLKLEVDRLFVRPVPRAGWDGYEIHYRFRATVYHIHVRMAEGETATRIVLDGVVRDGDAIPLVDDHRDHAVEVVVGR